jgi:hypothetical protein
MLNPFHFLEELFNLNQNNNREVSMPERKTSIDENMFMPESKTNVLSFFPIRNTHYEDDWAQVKENCENLSEWGLEKLQDGLKNSIRGIILEPFYICKDHRNLHSNFYSKRFIEKTSYGVIFKCCVNKKAHPYLRLTNNQIGISYHKPKRRTRQWQSTRKQMERQDPKVQAAQSVQC